MYCGYIRVETFEEKCDHYLWEFFVKYPLGNSQYAHNYYELYLCRTDYYYKGEVLNKFNAIDSFTNKNKILTIIDPLIFQEWKLKILDILQDFFILDVCEIINNYIDYSFFGLINSAISKKEKWYFSCNYLFWQWYYYKTGDISIGPALNKITIKSEEKIKQYLSLVRFHKYKKCCHKLTNPFYCNNCGMQVIV